MESIVFLLWIFPSVYISIPLPLSFKNLIRGAMVTTRLLLLVNSSHGQTKDYQIGIWCAELKSIRMESG
jgi:hypothetical protein